MTETLISPGVLAIENDGSSYTTQPIQAGAAIIGPAVKGKVGIPTIVTSYSDYVNRYGSSFNSGSQAYSYLTSISVYNYFSNGGNTLLVTRVASGSFSPAYSTQIYNANSSYVDLDYVDPEYFLGDENTFIIETLSEGTIMNSFSSLNNDGTLPSGSADNLRWEILNPNTTLGTFTLLIRKGNDSTRNPGVLETWSNLSLDPFAPNYIEKVIGNQVEYIIQDPDTLEYYTDMVGTYPNKSRYVRIQSVLEKTPNYFDNSGVAIPTYALSIPLQQSGSFSQAVGSNVPVTEGKYYDNISNTSIQGLNANDYMEAIGLLANKNLFQYNLLTAPGLIKDGTNYPSHSLATTLLVSTVETRGDAMVILDIVGYGSNILPVLNNAVAVDSSYAATYWPWLQTIDPNTGQQVWVPPSTMMPGVFAYNDSVGEPWLAPAGLTRGGLTNVIRAERNLTQGNKDSLYAVNVNPINTFPGKGIVVFGQKTLQKKRTALDRIGVRRLLIELKGYISQVADNLVFQQNTVTTRNEFLSQVNPYLSSVQQREGLYAFQVTMDETNNTPNTIDNNQLIGLIQLQPTKTAEFILLNFDLSPTGASFNS
jgi:hypothetical protein